MIGKIFIPKPSKPGEPPNAASIGTYIDENGVEVKGVEVIDIVEQVQALGDQVDTIEIHIQGPGGDVGTGDAIHDYLDSLNKTKNLISIQDGLLASIDTKIFMVAPVRVRDPQYAFIIHNPWNDPGPGDSNYQAQNLEQLLSKESELRKYYAKRTTLTEDALKPLMDKETNITPEQSVALGFATSLKQVTKITAMKTNKPVPTIMQRIAALYKEVSGKEMKAATEGAKSLDIPLADGKILVSDAADPASLKDSNVTLDGTPAEGEFKSQDGTMVIKATGGKVTEVTMPEKKTEEPDASARMAQMEASIAALAETLGEFVKASKPAAVVTPDAAIAAAVKQVEDKHEAQMMALRHEIGVQHDPKRAVALYASTVSKDTVETHAGIAARLKAKTEERKKNFNKK